MEKAMMCSGVAELGIGAWGLVVTARRHDFASAQGRSEERMCAKTSGLGEVSEGASLVACCGHGRVHERVA